MKINMELITIIFIITVFFYIQFLKWLEKREQNDPVNKAWDEYFGIRDYIYEFSNNDKHYHVSNLKFFNPIESYIDGNVSIIYQSMASELETWSLSRGNYVFEYEDVIKELREFNRRTTCCEITICNNSSFELNMRLFSNKPLPKVLNESLDFINSKNFNEIFNKNSREFIP